MRRIYVAATEQHAGKTTISVGLYRAALDRGYRACFIKPAFPSKLISATAMPLHQDQKGSSSRRSWMRPHLGFWLIPDIRWLPKS